MHLHNYLAGIYPNTQKEIGNLSQQTYIPTCEKSHVLVTYQILANRLKCTSCHNIWSYHPINYTTYDIKFSQVMAAQVPSKMNKLACIPWLF